MSDMQGTKEPPKTKLEILKFVGPMFVLAAVMIGSGELIARTRKDSNACIYIRNNNASSDCTLLGIWSIKSPFICFM